jgi:energy-coupling factor transport system ATP-binding protein
VLSGFSYSFGRGLITAVAGANGCGKTTLSQLLVGILKPTDGEVLLGGESVSKMTLSQVGRRVGLVMQNPSRQIFSTSVRDEMAMGLRNIGLTEDEIENRTAEYLYFFGLAGREDEFPFNLSMGERQRLVIAAVSAMKPEFLILDEPTSALDMNLRKKLGMHLRSLTDEHGTGIIIFSHDVAFIEEYADKVVQIDGGKAVVL